MEVAGVGRRVVDLGLTDATAVVVDGGRGMGLAAARCLADHGAGVALVGCTRAVLPSATADLRQRGNPDAVAVGVEPLSTPAAAAIPPDPEGG